MIFFLIMIAMVDNPTRQKIIMLLNRTDHMTVADLSREMGITPMAVRQHLMSLEKRGIINYVSKKYGIGRPVFLYSLTEKAKEIFPKSYGKFVFEILLAIEKSEGRKKLDKIFKLRKDNLLDEFSMKISGTHGVESKVARLAELLDKEGYMVELEFDRKNIYMKMFNCVLSGIPAKYPEACDYELALYRDLLGTNIDRLKCQKDGHPSCIYSIAKA